ncbi:ThiJ/PfpI domain protein [Solidesulfovibrio fructosivorans JJ]]|uniref:ThiJ/PfpI domain protein n=1 Tax=Solidesulfovibrio fructosivorans JJ] TaxID=596151 RepID=E1K2J7_SOLFR|nr:DJ-1/PfpI family protein [Solidesulfovibrio fructosivorans]EFL49162.1 ThiJ/PfpI domain protein [Solidesulfovibrio fructosivorans JJ]]
MKKTYVLLFDGYADWEIGFALAELRRMGNVPVVGVGLSDAPVLSMGGLKVQPGRRLSDIAIDDILLFILPGGMLWEQSYPKEEIHSFLQNLDERKIPTAAICAATTVLAKAGLLQNRKHTSNSLKYLRDHVPGYTSQDHYIEALAVTDGHITTASGLGSIDFTMKIMEALRIATPDMRALWYRAFKYGEFPEELAQGENA